MPDVVILAGGLGTRIELVSKGRPKALLPINGRVFLDFVIEEVSKYEIGTIYLSVYYCSELFKDYAAAHTTASQLIVVVEPRRLGTGGAVAYVTQTFNLTDPFFIINGDTLSFINLNDMERNFNNSSCDGMLGITYVKNASRFGTVTVDQNGLSGFIEKGNIRSGWVNVGYSIFRPQLFSEYFGSFSLEHDLIPKLARNGSLEAFKTDEDFIDIGTPEDYYRFVREYR